MANAETIRRTVAEIEAFFESQQKKEPQPEPQQQAAPAPARSTGPDKQDDWGAPQRHPNVQGEINTGGGGHFPGDATITDKRDFVGRNTTTSTTVHYGDLVEGDIVRGDEYNYYGLDGTPISQERRGGTSDRRPNNRQYAANSVVIEPDSTVGDVYGGKNNEVWINGVLQNPSSSHQTPPAERRHTQTEHGSPALEILAFSGNKLELNLQLPATLKIQQANALKGQCYIMVSSSSPSHQEAREKLASQISQLLSTDASAVIPANIADGLSRIPGLEITLTLPSSVTEMTLTSQELIKVTSFTGNLSVVGAPKLQINDMAGRIAARNCGDVRIEGGQPRAAYVHITGAQEVYIGTPVAEGSVVKARTVEFHAAGLPYKISFLAQPGSMLGGDVFGPKGGVRRAHLNDRGVQQLTEITVEATGTVQFYEQ